MKRYTLEDISVVVAAVFGFVGLATLMLLFAH
jgi:hypothetical protein